MDKFIKVTDVTKTYWSEDGKTETKVVLPLSLTIAEGEMVMFLGPSGCGKTTLMRIINQITAPDSGEITFDGEKLQKHHIKF